MKSIFVIGDSISMQYGPYLETMLKGIYAYARKSGEEEALRDLDNPQGANGGDSSMVLAYLRALEKAGGWKPDLLLLNCGLHDIKTDPATGAKQVPLESYGMNLSEIVALLDGMGISFVWIRTTPVEDARHNTKADFHRFAADVDAYNAVADAIMTEAGAPLLDLFTFTRNLDGEVFCDHVHYVEPVRAQQAAYIAGFLQARFG